MSSVIWKKTAVETQQYVDDSFALDTKWQEVNNREESYESDLIDQGLLTISRELNSETNENIRVYQFKDSLTFAKFIKFIYENKPIEYIEDYANLRQSNNYYDKQEFIYNNN